MRAPLLMRHPRVTIWIAIVTAAIGVVGLVLNMLSPAHFASRAGEFLLLSGVPVDALAGAYLVSRRPDNPLGYFLVLVAVGLGLDSPAKAILNAGIGGRHGAAESWSAWIDNTTWSVTYLAVALLALHYPDGRLPGPRWVRVRRALVATWVVLFVSCALVPGSANGDYPGIRTPIPLHVSRVAAQSATFVALLGIVAGILLGIVGLFLRGRRSRRTGDVVTAAQIHWLAWAALVAVVMVVAETPINALVGDRVPWLGNVVGEAGPYALVVALVVAVTRHGLFEIDRIVSRTVTYTVVSALLVGTYVAIIAGLSALLPARVGSLVVAAATLAVAALFVPVRRRVQGLVDRRFNRRRYDHARLVERFAESLRHRTVDGDVPVDGSDLLAVVHDVLEPQHAGVWLVAR